LTQLAVVEARGHDARQASAQVEVRCATRKRPEVHPLHREVELAALGGRIKPPVDVQSAIGYLCGRRLNEQHAALPKERRHRRLDHGTTVAQTRAARHAQHDRRIERPHDLRRFQPSIADDVVAIAVDLNDRGGQEALNGLGR